MEFRSPEDWKKIAQHFYYTDIQLQRVVQRFSGHLSLAVHNQNNRLPFSKSYLPLPTGRENGVFLAVEFDGNKVRVFRVRLWGRRGYVIEKKISQTLSVAPCTEGSPEPLITDDVLDCVAALIGTVTGGNYAYLLGHTFSFSVHYERSGDWRWRHWARKIGGRKKAGRAINARLYQALTRQGLENIRPAAILDDAAATLLSAAYTYDNTRVAVICGHGFDIGYFEPLLKMILTVHAGDYNEVERTSWDWEVDAASGNPGRNLFGKMVSSAYLSKIYQRTLCSYFDTETIPSFSTRAMNEVISTEYSRNGRMDMSRMWNRIILPDDVNPLRSIGAAIFVRAAQLAGAAAWGILRHLYGNADVPAQNVAVAGGIMGRVRGSLGMMEDVFRVCGEEPATCGQESGVVPQLIQDGAAVGAAVAAALSQSAAGAQYQTSG